MATASTPPSSAAGSLLARARRHDQQAIVTMFRQFVPVDEQIYAAEYLGTQGLWGIGTHSFACVTNRRVASLRVRLLGEINYEDADLEHVNSGGVVQPSKLLFIPWMLIWFGALFLIGLRFHPALIVVFLLLGVILLPLVVRLFYRIHKCGLELWVASRERRSVYAFSDRKLLGRANALYRTALAMRESRITGIPSSSRPIAAEPLAGPVVPAAADQTAAAPEPPPAPALGSFPPPAAAEREAGQ